MAWLGVFVLFLVAGGVLAGQTPHGADPEHPLPDAPQPQVPVHPVMRAAGPCPTPSPAKPAASPSGAKDEAAANSQSGAPTAPCPTRPPTYWFARFLTGPEVKPLTPKEKARQAIRNVIDPFNAITILGSSAISVGSDADSVYGPGMAGWGRSVGVSYTQDITGEFFSTFLIPSIMHQDPHYHRMPNATVRRRVLHAITQVVWTQGDNGEGMVNYADIVGAAIEDEVGNLYVPGRRTNLPASASRYGIGLATAPIDNFVSEFLPDVARHVHVQIVVIQRIINQVAKTDPSGTP
jgi:hypothetical protein